MERIVDDADLTTPVAKALFHRILKLFNKFAKLFQVLKSQTLSDMCSKLAQNC